MNARSEEVVKVGIGILATAAILYFTFGSRAPKLDLDTYAVLGSVAAEETAQLVGGQGQVLVLARGSGKETNPSLEAELSAFRRASDRHRGLSVQVEKLELPAMLAMSTGGAAPTEELFKALQYHPKARALVLFLGMPDLADSEVEALKAKGIKTVVISSFHPGYSRLLERQAIQMAIVPRPTAAPANSPVPGSVRERFDQEYAIIRAGNPAERR